MRIDWFRPRRLANRLIAGEVSTQEAAQLMLANFVLSALISYSALTYLASPPWTILSLLELTCVLVVNVTGFTRVYVAAGRNRNHSFVFQVNCLSFGVWVWSTVCVWLIYWAGLIGFRHRMTHDSWFAHLAIIDNLAAIGASVELLWTFMAVILSQVLYFSWLARVIPRAP